MQLPPSSCLQENWNTLRQVAPDLAELATGITEALSEKGVYPRDVVRQLLYLLGLMHQDRFIGGPLLLNQLQGWYLEGALSQGAFSLLTRHATALICVG